MTGITRMLVQAALLATSLTSIAERAVADDQLLFAGTWTEKGYAIAGGWSIHQTDGLKVVRLDEEFATRRAPDLKLFLSPLPLAELDNDNATEGSVLIAPLGSPKGAQLYEIDADVDLAEYQTILIHCQRFSKLWGGAALEPPE